MHKQAGDPLIRRSYVRMLLVNMFVLMTQCVCGFVDNLVISRYLGPEALAAVGFLSPVTTGIGMFNMIVIGAQILVGNYIGAGKKDRAENLFFGSFLVLGCFFAAVSLSGIFFRSAMAALVGAKGEVAPLLCDYTLGYFPGIPLQALTALLMAFTAFNNDMRRSYLASGVMTAGNLIADLLLVSSGMLGIGLATTVSCLAGFLILLPAYLNKDKAIHLEAVRPDLRLVGKAILRGLPVLMFTIGLVVKNALINRALSTSCGDPGIAVANVLFSACDIVGIFTGGCASAYSTLAGICWGEQDRPSFRSLFRTAAGIGFTGCVLILILIIFTAPRLSGLFFRPDFPARAEALSMFRLGFTFLPLNILMNLLMSTYQAQGKMKLVNVLSVAETALIGVFALLFVPVFGPCAAWVGNAAVDLFCLAVIVISARILKKDGRFDMNALLRLPVDFGASPDQVRECVLRSMEGVCGASESAVSFCLEKGIGRRTAVFAGLCIEEMARNIFQHGGHQEKDVYVDIRMVIREELTIRIRDNCIAFDPRKRLDQFDPKEPVGNIGIRLTAGLARQMDYYNNAGINTLIMKL